MYKLTILTVSFPYGNGEQFLETEIEYLSKDFDEIIIIPAIANGNMRPLPSNVLVDKNFVKYNSVYKTLINALLTIDTYKEIVHHPSILLSVRKLQRLFSFMGRGKMQFRYLKKYNSNESLYYSYWFNGSCYALYLLCKAKSIKYILRAHRGDLYLETNGGYLPFRKQIIENAYTVFSISQDGVNYMKKSYADGLSTPIKVSRLGTRSIFTDHINKDLPSNNQLHIISCAHLSPVKRVDMLVEALKLLGEKNSSSYIFWTHIGSGPLFDNIKTLSLRLPRNLVIDLKGHMENRDILKLYSENNFELFINTSKSEGIPVTFMEAMSFGIPVMAPAVGGIPEIVNNKNGFLLPENIDYMIIYEVLQSILRNKEQLKSKRNEAKKSWQDKYSAEKNYTSFSNQLIKITSEDILK